MPPSDADLAALVGRVYDAGMSFDLWPQVLTSIADAFGAEDASLGTMAPDALPWIFAPRTDPELMRTYAEAYHPLDQVWHRVTRRGVDRPATDQMVLPRNELLRSIFHNEWSKPQGYQTILGGMVMEERGWRTVLMLPGRRDFGADDVRRLQVLMPHLRRAVLLNIRLAQQALDSNVTAQLLDLSPAAAFLVDEVGRVIFANAVAEGYLAEGRRLRLTDGRIDAVRPVEADRLRWRPGPPRRRPSGRLRRPTPPGLTVVVGEAFRAQPHLGAFRLFGEAAEAALRVVAEVAAGPRAPWRRVFWSSATGAPWLVLSTGASAPAVWWVSPPAPCGSA